MASDGRARAPGPGTGVAGLRALAVLLVSSLAAYLALCRLDAINGAGPVLRFLGLMGLLFGLQALAFRETRRLGDRRGVLVLVAAGAVLFRLALLPAGLPPGRGLSEAARDLADDLRGERAAYERFQLYDDDLWRYLWDGHVAAHGLNPYRYAPADEALDRLAERERSTATDQRPVWADVRDNVNYPEVPTVYPPLAQALFRVSHGLAPGSVLAWKGFVVTFDLLAALLLACGLRAAGRPRTDVLLYAWNPLVVKVFAASGHVDALMVSALAGTAAAVLGGRRLLGGLGLGLAVAAKLSPIVLVPFLARRLGGRAMALAAGVVALLYAPYLDAGLSVSRGLSAFAQGWQFNAGPFALLRYLAAQVTDEPSALARVVSAAAIVALLVFLARRDDGEARSFPRVAAHALGGALVLGPAMMPWYLAGVLPLAILAGEAAWVAFSPLVCLSFLVMIDGVERAGTLLVEYGALATLLVLGAKAGAPRLPSRARAGGPAMHSLKTALALAALLGLPALASAQGSRSIEEPPRTEFHTLSILRSVNGVLLEADEEEGTILLQVGLKEEERAVFKVHSKIRLSADKKSALGGRKKLVLADFPLSQPVKVTFRTTDLMAVEMRLLKLGK